MKKPSLDSMAFLFVQLAAAERSGMPLRDALDILRRDHGFGRRGAVFDALAEALRGGATLSGAMQRLPEAFAAETAALVRQGEESGRLAGVLDILADDYTRRAASRGPSFKQAFFYPAALTALLAALVGAMLLFVLPAIKTLFAAFGADLPWPTLLVLAVSDLAVASWWLWLPLLVALIAAVYYREKTVAGPWIDALALRLPGLRGYLRKEFGTRLAGILERTLAGELPMHAALAHLGATAGNARLASRAQALEQRLRGGEALHEAVRVLSDLPRLALVVELGTRTGSLAAALRQSLAMSEAEVELRMVMMRRTLTALNYLVLGTVVGFVLIAVYLPIFKLGSAV
jgi:type IV pilus assembly protein PilC